MRPNPTSLDAVEIQMCETLHSASAMGEPSGSQTPRNNIYAAAPVPAGATYPQPLNTNVYTPNGMALHVLLPALIDSQSSGHQRSVSLNDSYSPGSLGHTKAFLAER